ncbi:MAG: S9 family peptidase [Candidatus Eisenbacteria bacterium]|nr:S9 family peptidase [Candidatus Eisenbacteria bacterium]
MGDTRLARLRASVTLAAVLAASLILLAGSPARAADSVAEILEGIDGWMDSDDSRVAEFIERHNARTEEALTSSPHWQPVYDSLSDVLGIDYVGSPDIDNTGRIYFKMRLTGDQPALFYMDEPRGWPTQISPNGWAEEGLETGGYTVAPSGDYLYLRVMKHGDENWDIYRFERDGTYTPLLVDRTLSMGSILRDGDEGFYFHIMDLRQGKFWLAHYDLASAEVDTLHTEPMPFGPMDYYDGKVLCVRAMSAFQMQLFEYDVETGEMRDLTGWHEFGSGEYAPDGRVLVTTDALSSDDEFMKVVAFEPGDTPVEPSDMTVFYDPGVEIDGFGVKRETETVIAVLNREGFSELVRIDMNGVASTVPSPGVGMVAGASSNDHGDLVFDFNSPTVPPTAFYLANGSDDIEQIGSVSTFGHDFSRVNVSIVQYPSKDGTTIPALLYLPEGAEKNGDNPAIIEYHGGPSGQNLPYFRRNIAFAMSQGVVFLFPNVRGSTGYGPAWERADNLEGRFVALEDAEAAIDYLVDEGWTSYERLALWGASYGGYTVDYLAVNAPEKFACGVSEVGVSDVDWTIEHGNPGFVDMHKVEFGEPGSELTKKLSAIHWADRVERPLFLTAGSNDPRVPPSDPRRFAYVLEQLGKDVLFYQETEAGHGASGRSDVAKQLARSYVFTFDHIMDAE